jgi:hypothetical protein
MNLLAAETGGLSSRDLLSGVHRLPQCQKLYDGSMMDDGMLHVERNTKPISDRPKSAYTRDCKLHVTALPGQISRSYGIFNIVFRLSLPVVYR